jgi:hypothetical protein
MIGDRNWPNRLGTELWFVQREPEHRLPLTEWPNVRTLNETFWEPVIARL